MPEPPDRLDSWKEIADYLGRGISTVRRWEREEGLPVRRHEHLKRGSVIAYRSELNAWLQSRTSPPPEAMPGLDPAVEPDPASPRRGHLSRRSLLAASATIPVAAGVWAIGKRERPITVRKLTSAREPSISADGSLIALARGSQMSILELATGAERPVATADAPKWSRDGRWLAYAEKSPGSYRIAICDSRGNNKRIIREKAGPFFDWMPDGDSLVVAHRMDTEEPIGAHSMRLGDGPIRRLTHPPAGTWGDVMLAVSFKGDRLALARYRDRGKGDIYTAKLDGSEVVRLTWLENWINGLTFTPDDSEIVFSSVHQGYGGLLRVPVRGGDIRPVLGAPEGSQWPCFAAQRPGWLCFHERHWESPLLTRPVNTAEEPRHLYHGMNTESIQPSRDGRWLAGIRSPNGLYLFAADGSSSRLVVESTSIAGRPSFSPDGRWLAFAAKTGERHAVHIVGIGGGAPQRLTNETHNEGRPRWSADGSLIYFQSDREGVPGVYRASWPSIGPPELIFRRGVEASESGDGKRIFVLPHEQDGILLVRRREGGEFRQVKGMLRVEPENWGCIRDGIYFRYVARDHSTGTSFLPYESDVPVALPANPVNAIGMEHLIGFALDWSGERMYWCHGQTPTAIYLGQGFAS